ncbi:hypothetical protein PV326_014009 [Microctonus aethiopoides]|nr:hypothetical protein PV326_014009 [Microctonus aethiopoides]
MGWEVDIHGTGNTRQPPRATGGKEEEVDGSRRRALVSWSPIFSDPSSGDLDFVTTYRRRHHSRSSSYSRSRSLVATAQTAVFLPNDKTFKEIVDLPVELIGHLLGNSAVAVQRRGKWEATW